MGGFSGGCTNACGIACEGSLELPERDRVRCPDCLEPELSLSPVDVVLDDEGAVRMTYEAHCDSCGFSVTRNPGYGIPLMAVLDAVVMLDVRLAT